MAARMFAVSDARRLPRLHQVEVVIWNHRECLEHLVEHVPVLRRDTDLDEESPAKGTQMPN